MGSSGATRISHATRSPSSAIYYRRFSLTWTDETERMVREHSGANPEVTADAASHRRDSAKATTAWKRRLDPDQIVRVRRASSRRGGRSTAMATGSETPRSP